MSEVVSAFALLQSGRSLPKFSILTPERAIFRIDFTQFLRLQRLFLYQTVELLF